MQGIFDSHAHYDDKSFDSDREEVIAMLREKGVAGVINVGCDAESSSRSVAFARKYPFFWAAVGIHPELAGEVAGFPECCAVPEEAVSPSQPDWLSPIEALLCEDKVVAVGEIGLDYHYDTPGRDIQKTVFEEQLKLAAKYRLPVIIHSRDASEDTMTLLRKYRPKGVLHCYSGSAETAREILKLGMYIGFTGAVSFPNAKKAKEVAAMLPLDRLLLETDCPYMAPVPFRGKRTTSDMIEYTAAAVAEVRGISVGEVVDAARENAFRLFGIKPLLTAPEQD